jgi:predicted PurR-regulated permease PerM
MPPQPPQTLEDRFFLWLLLAVSLLFALILWPFFAAVLWALVFVIIFMPLNRRLTARLGGRRALASLATVMVVLVTVILPLMAITSMLVQEASATYARMRSREIDFALYAQQVVDALPGWATTILNTFGLTDFAAIQERLSAGLASGSKVLAGQVLSFGQGTLEFIVGFFIMLYILFFLLRDGDQLMSRLREATPLAPARREALFSRFGVVVRASVKGNVVVALVQGALGGLIFWIMGVQSVLLWSVVMAVLSLLPAVGTALVWGPVALYFLATGAVVKGVVLIAYGVLVIGLVDNVLRPLVVGRDTHIPDYVILVATLGGIAVFGVNGFIVGPVIAALFLASWELFVDARTETKA